MKLAVFGATGGTGRHLVEKALDAGHEVTALARRPEAVSQSSDRLTIVQGDVRDPAAVERVIAGQDVVLTCLGARGRKDADLELVATRYILDAMARHGVRRLVVQGGGDMVGVSRSRHPLALLIRFVIYPVLLRREYGYKEQQEQLLQSSDVDWTVIKPSILTNKPARAPVKVDAGTGRIPVTISRESVAAFMLEQVDNPAFVRQVPRIGA